MNTGYSKIIYVASDTQLTNLNYYRRLWLATRNMGIYRRDWLDAIADAIRDFEGTLVIQSGCKYQIPCIDTTFGDDPDMRWIGHFMASNDNGDLPRRYSKKIERLRLIDLFFRIEHPDIARHFNR